MIVVRYATLVALVIWIGAMVDERLNGPGRILVVELFMLKFVGPPPIAFVLRAGIAVLMLAIAGVAAFVAPRDSYNLLLSVNIGLGFALLMWYARE